MLSARVVTVWRRSVRAFMLWVGQGPVSEFEVSSCVAVLGGNGFDAALARFFGVV